MKATAVSGGAGTSECAAGTASNVSKEAGKAAEVQQVEHALHLNLVSLSSW
jgi:hypothetical protein